MAYWLYREKGWSPYEYFKKPIGERKIIRAFFVKEMEEIQEARKEEEKWQKSMMQSYG